MGPSDSSVLHVSPAFCTAFNGVQFTWLLRMCDFEDLAEIDGTDGAGEDTLGREGSMDSDAQPKEKKINVTLYYKDGPARDVTLKSVR